MARVSSLTVDGARFRRSAHGHLDCTDCHLNAERAPHPAPEMDVLDCDACHDTAVFEGSDHGQRSLEAPGWCQRCHDPHAVSWVDSLSARERVGLCTQCHEDETLMASHGVSPEWARGYRQSFHGRSIRMGDDRVADCVSCHTAHDVRSSRDPLSTIHRSNLLRTCRTEECHPRASRAFLRGSPHAIYRGWKGALVHLVRGFYIVFIAVVVAFMLFHNLLDLRATRRDLRQKAPESPLPGTMLRWTLNERVQHGLLAAGFFVLALSGFVLKIPGGLPVGWPSAPWLTAHRGALHRAAAVLLIGLSIYHLLHLSLSCRGREQARELRPRVDDLRELAANLRYFWGRRDSRFPKGRFGYVEKFEYFSLVWGTFVMAVTGMVMWLEELWPLYLVDLARVIHGWEAILAVLSLGVWHSYLAHWRPGVFPVDWSFLGGRVRLESLRREHPLEYERLEKGEDEMPGSGLPTS